MRTAMWPKRWRRLLGTLVQTLMVYGVSRAGGQSITVAVLREHACAPGLLAHSSAGGCSSRWGISGSRPTPSLAPPCWQGLLWAGLLWGVAEVIMAPCWALRSSSTALGGVPAALVGAVRVPGLWRHARSIAGAPAPDARQTASARGGSAGEAEPGWRSPTIGACQSVAASSERTALERPHAPHQGLCGSARRPRGRARGSPGGAGQRKAGMVRLCAVRITASRHETTPRCSGLCGAHRPVHPRAAWASQPP